jgi:hypothetical protein
MVPARWGARAIAAGAVACVLLAACGAEKYHYVDAPGTNGAYFKVPTSWRVLSVNDTTASTDRVTPTTVAGQPKAWHVVFDSDPAPSTDHADETGPNHVVGQAVVLPLSASTADQVSPKDLRTYFLGQDPIDIASQQPDMIEIISFTPIATASGVRGSHVVFNLKTSEQGWSTLDQTSMIDKTGSHAYFFDVRCESACYKANQDQIRQIVSSWQVRNS